CPKWPMQNTQCKNIVTTNSQKHLDHQSAPIDIHKAKSPFQVYQNSAAPGAPEHTLTPICAPGVFARTFQ
ncbi:MAG: hypothetical protein IKY60_05130, partial [Bacteroidales bacterium]|nr:hypothetical protein [Bacteroidales bacterium]